MSPCHSATDPIYSCLCTGTHCIWRCLYDYCYSFGYDRQIQNRYQNIF